MRKNYSGYIEVHKPEHPRARGNGYVFEHILVAEEKIGRPLKRDETVHHIDHNRTNNHPDNLEILTRSEHTKKYHAKSRKGENKICPICGSEFYVKPSHLKIRNTCSLICAGKLFKNYYTDRPREYKPTLEEKQEVLKKCSIV